MRVFVAGGSGVLGRALVPLLAAAGHEVTATTRAAAKTSLLTHLGATPVVVDAFDRDGLLRAVAGARPDAVVHLLTDLGGMDFGSNSRLRVAGSRNLVDAAREAGVRRMVAESISWVYRPGTTPAVETDPVDLDAPEPRRATIAAVDALERAVRELPLGVVLRFGLLYGPGTWYSRDDRFGQDARAGRLAATETVASFVHVEDAVRAVLMALDWPAGTWNVVDDEPASGRTWAPVFAAAVGATVEPAVVDSGDVGRPVSNARARDRGLELRHPTWREGFATS